MQKHNFRLQEIEAMPPYERMFYTEILKKELTEAADEAKQGKNPIMGPGV